MMIITATYYIKWLTHPVEKCSSQSLYNKKLK
jgi:hypothetical protein